MSLMLDIKQIANPERDTKAFLTAKRIYCLENGLDARTEYFDLPLEARCEIMRRAHSDVMEEIKRA